MKQVFWMLALGALVACQPQQGSEASLDTEENKTAYALGFKLGENLKPLELSEPELAAMQKGIGEGAAGATAAVDMAVYEPKVQQLAASRASRAAEDRRAQEAAFLEQAAAEEGATRYDSGLVMVTKKEGDGASPEASDRVQVHYHGTFTDGQVFDSSVQRGEPATFPLNGVIPCWTEALENMKVGGNARVICPSSIAYGDQGAPPRIPPGATLVFDVQLLAVVE